VGRIRREFVAWTLARVKRERLLVNGRLECFFDAPQLEVSGKRFEGATINYESNWLYSWKMLWVGLLLVRTLIQHLPLIC